jgi:hypothetical protein
MFISHFVLFQQLSTPTVKALGTPSCGHLQISADWVMLTFNADTGALIDVYYIFYWFTDILAIYLFSVLYDYAR